MNWLQKVAYNPAEMIAPRRYMWEDRENKVKGLLAEAKKEAEKLALKKGHQLSDKWNAMHGNHCTTCGRQIHVRIGNFWNTVSQPRLAGDVLCDTCDVKDGEIPFNVPDYRMSRMTGDPGCSGQEQAFNIAI